MDIEQVGDGVGITVADAARIVRGAATGSQALDGLSVYLAEATLPSRDYEGLDQSPYAERNDVRIPKRVWAGPHPEAWHWPNVFVQMLHGDWLSVCKCGVIHVGPNEVEVRGEADAHMPLFVAWKERGY